VSLSGRYCLPAAGAVRLRLPKIVRRRALVSYLILSVPESADDQLAIVVLETSAPVGQQRRASWTGSSEAHGEKIRRERDFCLSYLQPGFRDTDGVVRTGSG
jgi:hypothetical protein